MDTKIAQDLADNVGLVMRDQLKVKQRRHARLLTVDWSDLDGLATWNVDDGGASAFKVRDAFIFAAKHLCGLDDNAATYIGTQATREFHCGALHVTSLRKMTGDKISVYKWQPEWLAPVMLTPCDVVPRIIERDSSLPRNLIEQGYTKLLEINNGGKNEVRGNQTE